MRHRKIITFATSLTFPANENESDNVLNSGVDLLSAVMSSEKHFVSQPVPVKVKSAEEIKGKREKYNIVVTLLLILGCINLFFSEKAIDKF